MCKKRFVCKFDGGMRTHASSLQLLALFPRALSALRLSRLEIIAGPSLIDVGPMALFAFGRAFHEIARVQCGGKVPWPSKIRLGSDCSGLDGAGWAMKALEWHFKSEFGCDVDPACRAMLDANCSLAIV